MTRSLCKCQVLFDNEQYMLTWITYIISLLLGHCDNFIIIILEALTSVPHCDKYTYIFKVDFIIYVFC